MSSIPQKSIDLPEAVQQLKAAAATAKCWRCGCLHNSLEAIEDAIPATEKPEGLLNVIQVARSRLVEVQYDCLGCDVCYPPLAMNALNTDGEACPVDEVDVRQGWPPLPGAYTARRLRAPVAICTLTDEKLSRALANARCDDIAIVGTCQTENLGIERIVQNVLANQYIRFLVVCGQDSRQLVGHLPGQSLVALSQDGVDAQMRIAGARGRRPIIRNLNREAVEYFRQTVRIVDLVDCCDVHAILAAAATCARDNPGMAKAFEPQRAVTTLQGRVPEQMTTDPNGYFVVYVEREQRRLSLEHYTNHGMLDVVIEGQSAGDVYTPAIEHGLLSRLDHAAYLGQEFARAERALATGEEYIQDAAPERSPQRCSTRGCGSACQGESA